MKSVLVVPLAALLVVATGCEAERLTAPEVDVSPVAGLEASLSAGALESGKLDFSGDLVFIADISKGFFDQAAAERLRDHVETLQASLKAGDHAVARVALEKARDELTPAAVNDGDRGYIDWIFKNIHGALTP